MLLLCFARQPPCLLVPCISHDSFQLERLLQALFSWKVFFKPFSVATIEMLMSTILPYIFIYLLIHIIVLSRVIIFFSSFALGMLIVVYHYASLLV